MSDVWDKGQWMVSFRGPDMFWAAAHEYVKDYAPLWASIPWHPHVTQAIHKTAESALDQYRTLQRWEKEKTQPVKDVKLFFATDPVWQEVEDVH